MLKEVQTEAATTTKNENDGEKKIHDFSIQITISR